MKDLFAKSSPRETLLGHTIKCLKVFFTIRENFPYLPALCKVPQFFEHLFLSILFHDIGKGSTGFQDGLSTGKRWEYRHEILSAAMIDSTCGLDDLNKKAICLAVVTHHKGIGELREKFNTAYQKELFESKLEELRPNLIELNSFLESTLQFAKNDFDYNIQPVRQLDLCLAKDPFTSIRWYDSSEDNEKDIIHSLYGIFLRGFLIACDHLASGGKEEIMAGLKDIEGKLTVKVKALRPFQERAKHVAGNAFLPAPTGSGKTEASLLWAGRNQDCGRRIYYVLPYTASINAMSRRLSSVFGEDEIGVLHGKASYFAYRTLLEQDYSLDEAARAASEISGLSKKLYRPLKVLTPFQIIKAFFGIKGWESQLSEMAGGLFIFDEIHAYDANVTALILGVIERLAGYDARFLFLSATMPKFLRERIRSVLPDIQTFGPGPDDIDGRKLLLVPRHRVRLLDGEITTHLNIIRDHIAKGEQVLVVCNTVSRAQEVYRALKSDEYISELLHGRFILRDRERREKVIGDAQLLVGTQAVEVSLDFDFHTIFTEPAPIDAMVQRFGRVNRKGLYGVSDVHIFTKGSEKDFHFYDKDRVESTMECFKAKKDKEINDLEVQEMIERVYSKGYSRKEEDLFNETAESFRYVLDQMSPFKEVEDEDKDVFYNLIKSVEVVPVRFEPQFLDCMEQKKYFEAMRFIASISLGQRARLQKLERISRRSGGFLVTNARYDDDLGLLIDDIEKKGGIID